MNPVCEGVVARFAQHIERMLPAVESAEVERHLTECAECRGAFEETVQVVAALLAGRAADEQACDGAMTSALARIRAEGGGRAAPAKRPGLCVAWRRRPAAWAAAAALLLALGLWAVMAITREPREPHVVWVEEPASGGLDMGPGNEPDPALRPQPRVSVTVDVRWPVEERPVAGTKIEVLRGGRVIARGQVIGFGRNGTMRAKVETGAGVVVGKGDRVLVVR